MLDGKIIGPLSDFFLEMINAQQCDDSYKKDRNMSFEYHDGSIVSILVSKDSMKIRLQAGSLALQWLLVKEFIEKLEDMFDSKQIHEIVCFDQDIPLRDLFESID